MKIVHQKAILREVLAAQHLVDQKNTMFLSYDDIIGFIHNVLLGVTLFYWFYWVRVEDVGRY